MPYQQGDIVLVRFPFTDQTGSKKRPSVVVSNGNINRGPDLILAQITSNIRNDEFSFRLYDNCLTVRLHKVSEVRCHKIFTAAETIVIRKISSVRGSALNELLQKVKENFDVMG